MSITCFIRLAISLYANVFIYLLMGNWYVKAAI